MNLFQLRKSAAIAFVASVALLSSVPAAGAEPELKVSPSRVHCAVPLEVLGSGLPPNKAVSLAVTFDGTKTGDVTGVSAGETGSFRLPIPFALVEGCARDGNGRFDLSLDGQPAGISVDFEVVGPLPTPVPPGTGNGAADAGSESPGPRALALSTGIGLFTVGLTLGLFRKRRHTPTSG